jgi:hypothetical protein
MAVGLPRSLLPSLANPKSEHGDPPNTTFIQRSFWALVNPLGAMIDRRTP